ncbi:MAG: amino acid ABC transporter substrate-binding protein [Pseudomonadota bacterium]
MAVAQPASTIDKVKASGTMSVGYRESSVPFSYLDGPNPTGFGWEICMKIVDKVGQVNGRAPKVQTQAVTSANRIPLLTNGTIDIECGSTTNNADRQKQVAFGINYFYTGTRFLVKSTSKVKSLEDLKGQSVVSTVGTTNFRVLRNISTEKKLDIDLVAVKDHAEGALMVQAGRTAAFGMDDILLYGLKANAVQPSELAVVGDPIQTEPYAIMLRRDDPTFKKLVDDTLTELIRSGEFEKLYAKWFMSPIPPRGISLQVPMSAELRENMRKLSDQPAL